MKNLIFGTILCLASHAGADVYSCTAGNAKATLKANRNDLVTLDLLDGTSGRQIAKCTNASALPSPQGIGLVCLADPDRFGAVAGFAGFLQSLGANAFHLEYGNHKYDLQCDPPSVFDGDPVDPGNGGCSQGNCGDT
jgi:hypothetical protein